MHRIFLAGALLLAAPPAVSAGQPGLLGATLGTSEGKVVVISRATVPTSVLVSVTEGDYVLRGPTAFRLEPNETRAIPYQGQGRGSVMARLTPLDADGQSGAIELTTWLGYEPQRPLNPWPLIAVLVMVVLGLFAWRYRRRVGR